MRILLIEDDEFDAHFIQRLLQHRCETPYDITWKRSFGDALQVLKAEKFDLCLLDLGLPDVTGLSALDQLASSADHLPVIVVTGNDERDLGLEAVAKGADDYLAKYDVEPETMERIMAYAIERRRHRLQLCHAEEEKRAAYAASQAKSEFLANVSHEIRTPLNAILGFAELIAAEPKLPGCVRENVETIEQAGTHLLGLMNDVLEMSRIEAGLVKVQARPFDLMQVIHSVGELLAPCAHRKQLYMQVPTASGLPRYVCGDEGKLRQVLMNLVGNAIKFTETGGVTLSAELVSRNGSHCRLQLMVRDTGRGIPQDDLERIFQPFEQVQSAITQSDSGAGLGLALCRKFAETMGGRLQVESTLNEGSSFIMEIELTETTREGLQPKATTKSFQVAEESGVIRALVVDDSAVNRKLLSTRLALAGLETMEAEDGAEAVQMAASEKPHVIFMDRRMPRLDGIEATRRIKSTESGQNIPVIMVTACAFEEDRQKTLDSGVDAFLRKPVMTSELMAALEECLGIKIENEAPQEKPPAQAA